MKVILTEKPSVARDISRCLGIDGKHDGYFEGKGYRITWAFGHLVELQEPDEYDPSWKRWNLASLPMIPEQFGLRACGDASSKKQLQLIKRLFREADEIICATDAGREGELIFRYILTWSGCAGKPFKRLWISSMTDEAIRDGFAKLRDGRDYDGLYRAAKCRSESDWIVGLNATRLYTLKFGQAGELWTIGRVQTPVLALIVQKDEEIAGFVAKDFWELHSRYRDTDFQYTGGRFDHKADAERLLSLIEGQPFTIAEVKAKRETLPPPLLYDLTELQKDMSIRHGLTAEQTLNATQQLYEKKLITYPRTDSRYLSSDMKAGMKTLLEKLRAKFSAEIDTLDLNRLTLGKRLFNDTKVADHHAIIPTGTQFGNLSEHESKIYHAVTLRFIAAFYPPCIKQITTVFGNISPNQADTGTSDIRFKTSGTVIEAPGWLALYKNDNTDAPDKTQKLLPVFSAGESGPQHPSLHQGKTKPPKPYNEASLLAAMESAGKNCDDELLKEALKEKGLGTPATRASIIEVLLKRCYIRRQRKTLTSTESGRHLISLIGDRQLKSAEMTGEWEAKLKQMEHNGYDQERFIGEIVQFTRKLIAESDRPLYDRSRLGDCPLCGQAIIEGRKGYGCSAWKSGCGFVLWKTLYGITVTHDMAAQMLQLGRTLNHYAIKADDRIINARLSLNKQGETAFVESANKPRPLQKTPIGDCPLCNGKIIETAKAYSCSEWRNGCPTTIWKTIAHKKISTAAAKKLLSHGETGWLKGFKSSKGAEFEANLRLINGKVEIDFSSGQTSKAISD